MVKSSIIEIITENLEPYVTEDGVGTCLSNGFVKYTANLRGYRLKISYECRDNLYMVRIEEIKCNEIEHVFFLTKSKNFQKAIKKSLRKNGFSPKDFNAHVTCLCKIIRKQLDDCGNLNDFMISYPSDLEFEGIFL